MMRHDKRFVWLIGDHHLLHHRDGRYNFGEGWIDSLCGTRFERHELIGHERIGHERIGHERIGHERIGQ
jgi:sterol desaturase/sphingolipid hydroxylase (fatty acid hydroxylase superfamily)